MSMSPSTDHENLLLLAREVGQLAADLRAWRGAIEAQLGQGGAHFREIDKRLDAVQYEYAQINADVRRIVSQVAEMERIDLSLSQTIAAFQSQWRGARWALGIVGVLLSADAIQWVVKAIGALP